MTLTSLQTSIQNRLLPNTIQKNISKFNTIFMMSVFETMNNYKIRIVPEIIIIRDYKDQCSKVSASYKRRNIISRRMATEIMMTFGLQIGDSKMRQ